MDALETLWRDFYPPDRRNELTARRDWQQLQRRRDSLTRARD